MKILGYLWAPIVVVLCVFAPLGSPVYGENQGESVIKFSVQNRDYDTSFAQKKMMDSIYGYDSSTDVFLEEERAYYYKVQILDLGGNEYTENLKLFIEFMSKETYYNKGTGSTSILIGKFTKYKDAVVFRDFITNNGVEYAFVVGFYRGVRVSDIKRIIEMEEEYELLNRDVIITEK